MDKFNEQKALLKSCNKEERKLLAQIRKNYGEIDIKLEIKYDKDGKIKNKKHVIRQILDYVTTLNIVWANSILDLEKSRRDVIDYIYNAFNITYHKAGVEFYAHDEFIRLANDAINGSGIKVKKIFKARKAYIANKFKKETIAAVNKDYPYSKIVRIATTNFYNQGIKTADFIAGNELQRYKSYGITEASKNVKLKKRWIYTHRSKTARDWHKSMHGQWADDEGYFTTALGNKAIAPREFHKAVENVNCKCEMELTLEEGLSEAQFEIQKRKGLIEEEKEIVGKYKDPNKQYEAIRNFRLEQRKNGVQYWRDVDSEKWMHSQEDIDELKRIGMINDKQIERMRKQGFIFDNSI